MIANKNHYLVIVVFSLLGFLAIFSQPSYAQACGKNSLGDQRACIQNPEGILAGNKKAAAATQTGNWMLTAVPFLISVYCLCKGSMKLSAEDYKGSFGPFAGMLTSGIATFVAYSIGA